MLRPLRASLGNLKGYGPALGVFLLAVALHWMLINALGFAAFAGVIFVYVAAIVLGGWCGYGPGFMVVLLVFLVPGFLFSPNYSARNINPSALGVSLLLSAMVSRGASSLRRSQTALLDTNEDLERRVQEKTAALEEANAALQRHNAELVRMNADLEQFAYSASHDLQEPLRMVSLFTQMLKSKYGTALGAEGEAYINHAVAGAKRLETLVSGLRSYLTIAESGELPAEVDTNLIVSRCLENLKLVIAQSGARCEVEALPPIRLHEIHVEQLFQNLIANGIKYRSAEAPVIRISARQEDGGWVFAVQDNGIGIDPQYHAQIFGVFKRLHRAEEYEGTGIGLAICKRIVDRYAGKIWVESEPGRGSTFLFRLPA